MRSPYLVNIAEVMRRAGSLQHVHLDEPVSSIIDGDPRLDPAAVIAVDLQLESLTDGIVVHGTIDVPWTDTCRRCLNTASGVAHSDIDELYQQVVTNPDAFPIVGDQLDLAPMVRDAVLLDTPQAPLCRADCAGLCPTCGIDRNEATCSCAEPPGDPRWSQLDGLRRSLEPTQPSDPAM
jgi:uncharacterized protein